MATQVPNAITSITIKSAPHSANLIGTGSTQTSFKPITTVASLLSASCFKKSLECKTILHSTYAPYLSSPETTPLYASTSGFVKGSIDAYNQHHHLIIRPEDVWFAILTQFSCYVNAHAEELRGKFVAHEGRKELVGEGLGYGIFAEEMARLLEENVVDLGLREWIIPDFSTTTRDDRVVASVLMMGTMQKYFSYTFSIVCGIPSVTLLGTVEDWENILLRVEKLKEYGEEPAIWCDLLRPILKRFVSSMKDPGAEEVLDFWQRIVHYYNMGSGPTYLSGRITAFCFWDEDGKLMYSDPGPRAEYRFPNPMFAGSLGDTFILHYGTDPLQGFHLATAYASLTSGSPLKSSENLHIHKVVAAARLQFRKWCASFKEDAQKNLTIRFFAGDALAFCHTLQHMHTTGDRSQSNWYRDQYHLEALVLDGEDYASNGNAPLLFNVIDTSNLLDHVGAINLLVAASPLLENNVCATLYTEALVKKQEDLKALVDDILCGHFPTLSIIFGLMPIEYWTNSTATSGVEEHLLDIVTRTMANRDSNTGQMHSRLTWKRFIANSTAVPVIRFDGLELAHILYQVYLRMFRNEDMTQLFSKIDLQMIHNSSLLHYHRGSLASFLRFVKQRVVVDWNETMNVLIGLVENNSNLLMSSNYMQELYLQLHLLDLHTVSTFRPPFKHISHSQALKGLSAWKEIPAVVCITLKVPRTQLRAITEVPLKELGTPILHCVLQSSSKYPGRQWQNIFAVVQLAFGEVTTSGSGCDDGFKLSVSEDAHSWNGHSSLLVSFVAPSWVILLEPQAATVAVGIQSTPQSSHTFMDSLGLEMNIYKTTLGNEENVYMSKYRPNLSGHASVCNFEEPDKITNKHTDEEVATIVKASVDLKTGQITALIGRLDIRLESIKSSLRNGAAVEIIQTSPCTISVAIGKAGPKFHLLFPVPVQQSRSKSRIARKSSYIEVIAPMADPRDGGGFPHFMCPMFPSKHGPVVWNMPRLNLDCLPIIDTSKKKELEWLTTHVSLMLSSRERHLREKSMESGAVQQKDARINLKDSLFSLFMHFSGLQGQQARIFGINNPGHGGVHILVFVSCLRLDLANHTVVLDAAILPLHDHLMPKLRPFLEKLTGIGLCSVIVDDDELRLWKEIIPAWVERCRQWEHRPSCEYLSKSKIPLSVDHGQNPICSCGEGTLPSRYSFDLPRWKLAAKHAVQAAISPSFSVPFVEQSFEGNDTTELAAHCETGCRLCGKGNSDDGGKGLLRCSRCLAVRYCSVECQKADWKEHKKVCKK